MKIRLVLKYTILMLILVSCSKSEKLKLSTSYVEFSTDVKITVFGVNKSDTMKVNSILKDTKDIFEFFNAEMNPYIESSSLSRLNSLHPGDKIAIPDPLKEILKVSVNISKYTDGAFDVAILPIVELWGFYTLSTPSKPNVSELDELLKVSQLESYKFENDSVSVVDDRCKIGLGGIAKGCAVDSVAAFLTFNGINDFIVEAGGDLIVRSSKPKTIGIKHPRIENELIDTLYVSDAAVATSGDYEKFLIEDGIKYCHIINPETGYGLSDCISVTIISRKTYLSDAFATAVFAMGKEKGKHFIKKNGLGGLICYLSDDGVIMTEKINLDRYSEKNKYEKN